MSEEQKRLIEETVENLKHLDKESLLVVKGSVEVLKARDAMEKDGSEKKVGWEDYGRDEERNRKPKKKDFLFKSSDVDDIDKCHVFFNHADKTVLLHHKLLQKNYWDERGPESDSSGEKSAGQRDSFQDSIVSDCDSIIRCKKSLPIRNRKEVKRW